MLRVLLVDDEVWVVESLKTIIDWEAAGCRVMGQAYSGIEALGIIVKEAPDIVFTDIRMPDMNGLELIKKVNDLGLDIAFIVASGYAEFAYAQKALNYGAVGYCLKPFDETEILSCLKKVDARKPHCSDHTGVKAGVQPGAARSKTVNELVDYVNANFCERISIHSVSRQLFVNPDYLSRVFKREVGLSFIEYLTKLRVDYASQLLRETDMPVQQISEKSGYTDYFYFTKIFKKVTGKTPSQYRSESAM